MRIIGTEGTAAAVRGPGSPRSLWAPGAPVRRLAAALGIVLGLASVVSHALEYRGVERFSKDFALDYTSAIALREGANPYAPIRELVGRYLDPPPGFLERHVLPGGNWHPPFKVASTVPLSYLPYRAAGVAWLLFSAVCLVWAVALLGRELGWRRRASLAAGVAALALPVFQIDLSAGQLNGPLLLLIVAAWRFVRRDAERAAGVALGVAAALKFFPGFMALPLLGAGRRRAAGSAIVTFAVLTGIGLLAGGLASGGGHLDALRSEGFGYWATSPANLSWWGLATRWLSPNGWVRGADLEPLGVGLAVAGVLTLSLLALRPPYCSSGDRYWAAAPLMVLAWPIAWDHYLVLALPWVILVLGRALSSGRPRAAIAAGAVSAVLMLGFPPGLAPIERAPAVQVALGYQLPTLGLLLALALEARSRASASRAPAGAAR